MNFVDFGEGKFGHGEVRVYRGTGVSRGVRRTTWERSLKNWELQIYCFEEFLGGGHVLGLVPASLPHTLGYACTFYAPTSPPQKNVPEIWREFWRIFWIHKIKAQKFQGKFRSNFFLEFRRVTIRGAQPSARLSEEICLSEGSAGVPQRALRGLSEGSAGSLRSSAGVRRIFRDFPRFFEGSDPMLVRTLVAPCGWEFNRGGGRGWESQPLSRFCFALV